MKVLSLQCAQQHSFEGWFGSEDDFQSQLERKLVQCPMCNDSAVVKMPSAPRLNLGGHVAPAENVKNSETSDPQVQPVPAESGNTALALSHAIAGDVKGSAEQQALFLKALRHVVANTEDVGDRFAHQARAMHYGEAEPRSIRGQTTKREAIELMEEGIEVMPLPMPAALKETLQ
jgi:hypothetical protein